MRLALSMLTLLVLVVAGALSPETRGTPRAVRVSTSAVPSFESAAVPQAEVLRWEISHALIGERYASEISDQEAIEIALRRGEELRAERAGGGPLQVSDEDAAVAATPVKAAEVEAPAQPSPDERSWRVVADRVNLRSGPGTENPVIGRADRGETLVPLSGVGEAWIEVLRPSGGTAWIFADFLLDAEDLS